MIRVVSLICALSMVSPQARAETRKKEGLFEADEGMNLPFMKQTMKGLSHRFFDPETGVIRYQITAELAVTRLEGQSVVFDVDKPDILYFDKEQMHIESARGKVNLKKGKEGFHLAGGVRGHFDTARTVKFETEALEMSFDGDGHSNHPIRFTQKGVTLVGERSVFFRTEVASSTKKEEIAKVIVFGPGYAQFDRASSEGTVEVPTKSRTASFLVEFNGAASYSQLQPIVFFTCKTDTPDDRVILYGEGYILRCRELQVHSLGDMKSWERLKARGDAKYQIVPGRHVLDRLAELQKLNSIRGLPSEAPK